MSTISLLAEAAPYYTTADTSGASDAATAGVMGVILVFTLLFAVAMYAVQAFLTGRIFKKAGVEEWKAWVPVYNNWVLYELGGQQGFWAIILLIPLVNIIAMIFLFIAQYHIGLKLGKESVFVLLAIFLPLVWLIWLAVDSSKWQAAAPSQPMPQQS